MGFFGQLLGKKSQASKGDKRVTPATAATGGSAERLDLAASQSVHSKPRSLNQTRLPQPAAVRSYLKGLTFSDHTSIQLSQSDIVVFVGPNNSGKSAALKGIERIVRNLKDHLPVIEAAALSTSGSSADLQQWLTGNTSWTMDEVGQKYYERLDASDWGGYIEARWKAASQVGLRSLASFLLKLVNTEKRLSASNAAPNVRILNEKLTHPIHVLQANVDVETRFSEYVRDAFGMDIVVHRNAGNEVPLLCGRSPEFNPGEDRLSLEYLKRLDGMPRMEAQGDGIRSFVGLLLHAIVVPYNILLADEPEAFLHPPQARLVGRLLATEVPTTCQLFLATHSGDVIKGLLDAGSKRVRVIRIVREGHINRVRELSNPDITQLWSDPVIRHSNVLDGLFHQNVVVCEAEGDCRFFEAMMCTADQPARILTRPNFMFVSASGSDRLHVVATALRRVGVPVAVLADFDVISEESKFQRLVEACGVPWREVAADWKVVWSSVNKRKPELDTADVKKEISAILDGCQSTHLPEKDARRIRSVIARSSSWQEAKNAGVGLIPSGDETQACQRLIKRCKESGLFILTCGELERFCPTIGGHGPTWVNNVLQRDLGSDPELQAARDFAGEIREWANGTSPGETADAE